MAACRRRMMTVGPPIRQVERARRAEQPSELRQFGPCLQKPVVQLLRADLDDPATAGKISALVQVSEAMDGLIVQRHW